MLAFSIDYYGIFFGATQSVELFCTYQVLTISFNQNVTYVSGGAGLISGNGTPTLKVKLSYHQNPTDNIGFGDLVVTSDAGLSISSVSITD